jgi:hypothetical protein
LIMGAILGFIFNRANDNRKVKREDEIRWHQDIREIIAQLIQAVDELRVSEKAHAATLLSGISGVQHQAVAQKAMSQARANIGLKSTELSLLASEDLHQAARAYIEQVAAADLRVAIGKSRGEVDQGMLDARAALVKRSRAELGIRTTKRSK